MNSVEPDENGDPHKYQHTVYAEGFLVCDSDIAPTEEEYLKMVDRWRNFGQGNNIEQS